MRWKTTILGGVVGLICASLLHAEPQTRPLAREDAATALGAADPVPLSSYRTQLRPDHMIRYPVAVETDPASVRPKARSPFLPSTNWSHKDGSALWTRAAMVSVGAYGDGLDSIVPRDIDRWCPAYEENSPVKRRAFWVGMMSALAKFESTWNPQAVGGGDLWYGLLQIYPDTARRYGCRARTGEALKNPTENLSCAARIMAVTVERDQAVAIRDSRWRGVAADWGPMTKPKLIDRMANWTRSQNYCVKIRGVRPQMRPETLFANLRPNMRPDGQMIALGVPAITRPVLRPEVGPRISTMGVASHLLD